MRKFLNISFFTVIIFFFAGVSTTFSHPTINGETGLFGVASSDTMQKGDYSFGFYLNNWDRELGDSSDAMDLDISAASTSFFYAITSRIEVGVQAMYLDLYSREEGEAGSYNGGTFTSKIDESGFGDVHFGVKLNILNSQEKAVGLGVMVFTKLATADDEKGLGSGQTDYGTRLLFTKPFEAMTLHANAGYTIIGEPEGVDWDNVIDYSVGVNFPNDADDNNFLQFIGELSGANDPDPDLPSYLDLTLGVRYFFSKQFHANQRKFRNGWALSAAFRYNVMMQFDDCPIGGLVGISFVPPLVPAPPPPPPAPPRISGVEGLMASIKACEMMNLKVNATDPDNDITEYQWKASCGTIVGTGPSIRWEAPCPCTAQTPKTCTISCKVIDSKGQSDLTNNTVSIVCPPPPVKKEPPKPPTFENVYFAPGSARVDNIAKAILDEIALKLQNDSRLHVIIQGNTDNRGSDKNNMKMGLKRADNVKDYLVKQHNIDSSRLETLSFGSSKPIGDNHTKDGRAQNRRVDFNAEYR